MALLDVILFLSLAKILRFISGTYYLNRLKKKIYTFSISKPFLSKRPFNSLWDFFLLIWRIFQEKYYFQDGQSRIFQLFSFRFHFLLIPSIIFVRHFKLLGSPAIIWLYFIGNNNCNSLLMGIDFFFTSVLRQMGIESDRTAFYL